MAKKRSPYISILSGLAFIISAISLVGASLAWMPHASAHARSPLSTQSGPFDFGNQTFTLGNEELSFKNGFYASRDARHLAYIRDQSVNQTMTKAAAILIDSPEGSGTFYYVLGAMREDGKAIYSTPVFLGDRIKIELIHVGEEAVTVHYLARPANASMATEPTQRASATYTFNSAGNLSPLKHTLQSLR